MAFGAAPTPVAAPPLQFGSPSAPAGGFGFGQPAAAPLQAPAFGFGGQAAPAVPAQFGARAAPAGGFGYGQPAAAPIGGAPPAGTDQYLGSGAC